MAKEKVFAVFGLGTFGREVCRVLAEKGGKVMAFDNQPQLVEKIKDTVTQALLLDSTDEEALRNAPLEDVDVAVVAIGENIEGSIITTALLKNAGVPYILARAVSDIHQQVLKHIGVNEVINLEIDEGRRIATRLISPEVLDTVSISEDFSIAEVYVPEEMVGKTLEKLDLRKRYNLNVMAIKRQNTTIDFLGNPVKSETIVLPASDEELKESDILLVLGRNRDLDVLRER